MKREITIVGAGLVGCVCALYFAKRDYQVTLFERRPDMRKKQVDRGRSINLALSHRGISALSQLNLSEKILAHAVPMYGRCVHDLQKNTNFQPYSFHPHEFNYSVSREFLNQQLLDALEDYSNVKIQFEKNITLKDIQDTQTIIADGASSHIRKELQLAEQVNFSEIDLDHAYKELTISAVNGQSLKKNYLHIWPRNEFMLIALPNFDGSFTCTLFMPLQNFSSFKTEAEIKQFFQVNFAEAVALMPDLIEQYSNNPVGLLKTVSGTPWVVNDKLLFIGDAAHAIVPFLGQGMNCGFEDCQILNGLLDSCHDNLSQAFKLFAEARKADTDAIAQLSLENYLEMRQKVIDETYLKKRAIEQELVKKFPTKYRPLYELISYTSTPYSQILQLKLKREKLLQRLLSRP